MANSRIAICLYKDHIASFDVNTFLSGSLSKVSLKVANPNIFLYQRKSDPQPAPWVDTLKHFSNIRPSDSVTASTGAILIIKTRNRFFGCCFGTSVVNINRENIETDFGLAAAFRRMTRTDLKSVQSFSLSANPITSQRTSTLPTPRDNFNIDGLAENITELEGYSRQGTTRTLIKGKEFYSCPIIEQLNAIIALCGQLLLDYQNARVRQDFLRLSVSRKVKDKETINVLNEELCDKVQNQDSEIFLTDYEHFPDVASYKLMDGTYTLDLSLGPLLKSYKPGKAIDVELLKANRIIPNDSNGLELSNWSLFKSLFVQLDSGQNSYILFKSIWYEINPSYLSNLQGFLDGFHLARGNRFPRWNGVETEAQYNSRLVNHINGQLWDRRLFVHEDYNYGLEFCDVLADDYIIAVKKYESSGLNSHLLMQTLVALQLVDSGDMGFFDWVAGVCNQHFNGVNQVGADVATIKQTKTIVILLLANRTQRASQILPLFSLIAFKLVLTRISNMGFTVRVVVV